MIWRSDCVVCGSPLNSPIAELPGLPLTGLFRQSHEPLVDSRYDQAFSFCDRCHHGQLGRVLDPSELYGESYFFRTTESQHSQSGVQQFLGFIDDCGATRSRIVIDVGCNDLHLLERLKSKAEVRVGIDPIWKGREELARVTGIDVFGGKLEDFCETNLGRKLDPSCVDTVVCRHTLEHIPEPRAFLNSVLALGHSETKFFFEFPNLNTMLKNCRFDHVFHQHVNYFSENSFSHLLNEMNCEIFARGQNASNWDASFYGFKKGFGKSLSDSRLGAHSLRDQFAAYRQIMKAKGLLLSHSFESGREIIFYGASLMLPVIIYYLNIDSHKISCAMEDGDSRLEKRFQNLPFPIVATHEVLKSAERLQNAHFVIGALEWTRPMLKKILERGGRITVPQAHF